MTTLSEYVRFWPYAAAVLAGAAFAVIDAKIICHYVLGALLVLVAAGGQLGMYLSPFTFHGGDYYIESLIALLFALAGLAGYVLAVIASCARTRMCRGKA